MEGDANGTQATGTAGIEEQGAGGAARQQAGTPAAQPGRQEPQGQVTGTGDPGADGYQEALAAKDAKIAELSAQVAEAAKSAETAEALNAQIAELKRQMADERVDFALRAAGARSVKAAKALLGDYEGSDEERVAALAEACPWMFAGPGAGVSGAVPGTSQNTSQLHGFSTGATGLEPAGVAGGGDGRDVERWERIAGLADEKEGR